MTNKELNQADATKALNEAHSQLRTTACTHAICGGDKNIKSRIS